MTKSMIAVLLAAGVLAGCAAAPQTAATATPAPAQAASTEVASTPNGQHCYYEAPTGTRFKQKICTSTEQSQNGQALVRDIQNRGSQINPQGF